MRRSIWDTTPIEPISVAELIRHLQTFPQDALVAYCLHSEQILMEKKEVILFAGCEPRPDGWVHHERPDKPSQTYVLFPGN